MLISLWIQAESGDDQEQLQEYLLQIRSFLEQPRKYLESSPVHLLQAYISEIYSNRPNRYKLENKVHPDFASRLVKKPKAARQA